MDPADHITDPSFPIPTNFRQSIPWNPNITN